MEKHSIRLPDGRTFSSGTGGIAIGSVKLTQTVNSGNELTPGSVCATLLELELMDTGSACPLQAGDEFTLLREDRQVGIFTVENPTRIGASRFSVTAYDRVAKLDQNLEKWLDGLTGWPYPLEEFTRMVCEVCGVSADLTDVPNGVYPVRKFSVGEVTGRQLVGWAAQIMGRFCRATELGTLAFSWYTPAEKTIGSQKGDQCTAFFEDSLSYSDYTVSPVDAVALYSQDEVVTYPADGGQNVYAVTGNPYLTGTEADAPVAEHLYAVLSGLSYTPASVTVPAGLFQPGQQVYVTDATGKLISILVMTAVRSGQRETLSCTGSASRERVSARNSQSVENLTGKLQALRTDVERLKSEGQASDSALTIENLSAETARQGHNAEVLRQLLNRLLTVSGQAETEKVALHINKPGEELVLSLDHTGIHIQRKNTSILRADASGVYGEKMQTDRLALGEHTCFMAHMDGMGCFYL